MACSTRVGAIKKSEEEAFCSLLLPIHGNGPIFLMFPAERREVLSK